MNPRIGFIGAGAMAKALANGFINSNIVGKSDIHMYCPEPNLMDEVRRLGYNEAPNNISIVQECDCVFLAIKPDILAKILAEIRTSIKDNTVLISIAPGWSIEKLEGILSLQRPVKIVRVMPNTPCLVGAGACALSPNSHCTEEDTACVVRLMKATGIARVVPEPLLDGVTGVAGSGVAFVFTMIEAYSDAGVKHGLPRQMATEFAIQTILGGALMAKENNSHTAVLREMVASPGGTTIAGIAAIEEHGLRNAIIKGVDAVLEKSKSLSKQ